MASADVSVQSVLSEVSQLPASWHGAGSLRPEVLAAIVRHAAGLAIVHSAETGTGKSTLLFSHVSAHHTVFAQDDRGNGDSLIRVQESPLLRRETVTFVIGPTQRTLPLHQFAHPLQLVMLDGPHGYPFPDLEYYFAYPHLEKDGLLIVDDIDVPNVFNMFCVLREDAMYTLAEVVHTTAFFVRTAAPLFDPYADGWWLQGYNKRRYPVRDEAIEVSFANRLKRGLPAPVRRLARRLLGRAEGV